MCGIYMTNIGYTKSRIEEKLCSIKFRGPDNLGYEKAENITLGHIRLSILDLEARSNQPYTFKNLKIVFNGEIYNYQAIKKELENIGYDFETTSDTEVLIKSYYEWGNDSISKLNGMFAFAIYDKDKNLVFCARDRLGVKPFYYYWKDGSFEICSQLRPLIRSDSKVSDKGISIYLDCGYIPTPYSIIQDIYKLPPGNFMEIDLNNGTLHTEEYWNLSPVIKNNITYEDAKQQLHELLKDAVKIRLQSDVPICCFLSGGIDSALISSIASNVSNEKINTFTIGFDDPVYDESTLAEKYSSIIGSEHLEIKCSPQDILNMLPVFIKVYDEPFADSSALPSLLLNSVAKQYATVALSGDGGDEGFLGYKHFDAMTKFEKIKKIPFWIRSLISKFNWYRLYGTRSLYIKGILGCRNSNELSERIFTGYDTLQIKREKEWFNYYSDYKKLTKDSLQKCADLNIKLWLENDSNVKVDRASMAFSVEVRSPFLDYRIIEFSRSLPVKFRYQKGRKKRILRDILNEYIPENIFDKPKKGFSIPLSNWIKNELKDDIQKELTRDFFEKVPNLDVPKFSLQMTQHFEGKYDFSFNIWKLYVLSKWYKEFGF